MKNVIRIHNNLLDKPLYLVTQGRGGVLPAGVDHVPLHTEADALGVGGHGGVGGVLEHVAVEGAILNTNINVIFHCYP